jgi:glycosyltransferase involved in cell wall biosynthesis
MTTKVHHIAVLIDCDKEKAIHWFELFRQIKTYIKSEIYFIVWNYDLSDIARSIVDIDKVYLMSRSVFKLNDYKLINNLIQEHKIEQFVEIGDIPQFVSWKLKKNSIFKIIKVLDKFKILDNIDYSLIIYQNYTAKINYQKKIAYIPYPQINYKDFLDLDTQLVLDIKRNLGLVSYDNQIISKSFVCGHLGDLTSEFIRYLEYAQCEWYDIIPNKGSFILPEDLSNNLPIVYELLDCIVVSAELDDTIQYNLLNAMASGTIIIVPRYEHYQALLGRGALYYSPNSSSELSACIDIIQKNENKKNIIRNLASEQFQRKYSYQAIAQFWVHLLAKI